MKKTLYAIAVIFLLGLFASSCAVDKKCPAYTKADTSNTLKKA
ncbi:MULTISPECIES: hypothetical protein [Marinifilum]|uniref:Lipoprotein n=1 Tax=Marinifilum flexuosum TaxID=1117708 RepID=A0A419WNE5_9BACT|nr:MULTISPECIES: hypothetical protein [Marinifilum]RKD96979.1 hypothetical protein BXY64_3936 [Marinifilum flexuosum]